MTKQTIIDIQIPSTDFMQFVYPSLLLSLEASIPPPNIYHGTGIFVAKRTGVKLGTGWPNDRRYTRAFRQISELLGSTATSRPGFDRWKWSVADPSYQVVNEPIPYADLPFGHYFAKKLF